MLLAFISLMKGITIVFDLVGLDFKQIIGYIFAPIALLWVYHGKKRFVLDRLWLLN